MLAFDSPAALDSAPDPRSVAAPPAPWRAAADGRRALIFVDDLSATGVARNAVAIANRLAADGFMVCVATCRAGGALAPTLSASVRTHVLRAGRGRRLPRPLRLAGAVPPYRRLMRDWRPDIAISAGNHGHLLSWAAWRGAQDTRRVYRISNDTAHPGRRGPAAWAGGMVRALQMRLIARDADMLALVSPHLRRNPVLAAACEASRACVIPNGVDADSVRDLAAGPPPHPWLAPGNPPVVLAVGRISRQKNQATLVRALALARRARPLRLIVLGEGGEAKRARLLSLAGQLGVSHCVDILPPDANPFPYMAHAAALALPSWWEGASNVLLEAMACGAPVVAARTAGSAQSVLGYGRYGLLVDPDDPHGLAEALLMQTGPLRCDGAGAGAERAAAYSLDRTLDAYSELAARLAPPSGRSSRAQKPGGPELSVSRP